MLMIIAAYRPFRRACRRPTAAQRYVISSDSCISLLRHILCCSHHIHSISLIANSINPYIHVYMMYNALKHDKKHQKEHVFDRNIIKKSSFYTFLTCFIHVIYMYVLIDVSSIDTCITCIVYQKEAFLYHWRPKIPPKVPPTTAWES